MGEERRIHERVRFPLDAKWQGMSGGHEARVYDLSFGGCYIEAGGHVKLLESLCFEIQSPTGRVLPLQGEVVHVQIGFGFAVRFTELSEEQQSGLTALLEYAQTR